MINKEQQKQLCNQMFDSIDKDYLMFEIEKLNIDNIVNSMLDKISKYAIIKSITKVEDWVHIDTDLIYKAKLFKDWGEPKQVYTTTLSAQLQISIDREEHHICLNCKVGGWFRMGENRFDLYNFDFEQKCVHTRNGIKGFFPLSIISQLSNNVWTNKTGDTLTAENVVKSQFKRKEYYDHWVWHRRF